MSLLLSWYVSYVPEKLEYLEEEKRPNTVWMLEYGSAVLPCIAVAAVLTVLYKWGYVAAETQRDKTVVVALVALFTYCVMFPTVLAESGGWQVSCEIDGEDAETLFSKTAIWFFVQLIPFALMLTYHTVKRTAEMGEMADAEEKDEKQ